MHLYIVFAHPSHASFTHEVLESFIAGLSAAGHTYEVGDLYAMGFRPAMALSQYEREVSLKPSTPLPADVIEEQEKIQRSDAMAFVYPVWWSDCPAILKGWFDRVWSVGYAYSYDSAGLRSSLVSPRKAVVLCTAGHPNAYLEEIGIGESMRRVMVNDRLKNVGFVDVHMEILGGMSFAEEGVRERNVERAFDIGKSLYVADVDYSGRSKEAPNG